MADTFPSSLEPSLRTAFGADVGSTADRLPGFGGASRPASLSRYPSLDDLRRNPDFEGLTPPNQRRMVADWLHANPDFQSITDPQSRQRLLNEAQAQFPDDADEGTRRLQSVVMGYNGAKYQWGGDSCKGLDCSAFTQQVLRKVYQLRVPRTAQQQFDDGRGVPITPNVSEMRPGDLLFFKGTDSRPGITHAGVYGGLDGQGNPVYYHMSSSKGGLARSRVGDALWQNHLAGVKRFDTATGEQLDRLLAVAPAPYDQAKWTMMPVDRRRRILEEKGYLKPGVGRTATAAESQITGQAAPMNPAAKPDLAPLSDPVVRAAQARNRVTPEQVAGIYRRFFKGEDTNANIPYQTAARLSKQPAGARGADAQLLKMHPITQAAILQKAQELSAGWTEAEMQNLLLAPAYPGGVSPYVMEQWRQGNAAWQASAAGKKGPRGALEQAAAAFTSPEAVATAPIVAALPSPVQGVLGAAFGGAQVPGVLQSMREGDYGAAAVKGAIAAAGLIPAANEMRYRLATQKRYNLAPGKEVPLMDVQTGERLTGKIVNTRAGGEYASQGGARVGVLDVDVQTPQGMQRVEVRWTPKTEYGSAYEEPAYFRTGRSPYEETGVRRIGPAPSETPARTAASRPPSAPAAAESPKGAEELTVVSARDAAGQETHYVPTHVLRNQYVYKRPGDSPTVWRTIGGRVLRASRANPAWPIVESTPSVPPPVAPAPMEGATGGQGRPEPSAGRPEPPIQSNRPSIVLKQAGSAGTAYTATNEAVPYRYALVEGADLIPSHTDAMSQNPAYDPALQPRDRSRIASEEQVSAIATNLNPARLGENASTADGAPIVGRDGQVESGNGRTLGILRAYRQGLPSSTAYRNWLRANAPKFGMESELVDSLREPVLVRVREGEDVDRAALAERMGKTGVSAMSEPEVARADAQRLTSGGHLVAYVPNEEGNVGSAANMEFVRRFIAGLPQAERAGMYQADGMLSAAGARRIRNAILGAAYEDTALLSRLMEDTDLNIRTVGAALLNVAPKLALLKQKIAEGQRYPMDITGDLAQAANALSRLRDQGMPVKMYLDQLGMFGDALSPVGKDLLRHMENYKRSGKKLTQLLDYYAESVEAIGDPKQQMLFGAEAPPTPRDVLEAARQVLEEQNANDTNTVNLFDESAVGSNESAVGSNEPARRSDADQSAQRGDNQASSAGAAETIPLSDSAVAKPTSAPVAALGESPETVRPTTGNQGGSLSPGMRGYLERQARDYSRKALPPEQWAAFDRRAAHFMTQAHAAARKAPFEERNSIYEAVAQRMTHLADNLASGKVVPGEKRMSPEAGLAYGRLYDEVMQDAHRQAAEQDVLASGLAAGKSPRDRKIFDQTIQKIYDRAHQEIRAEVERLAPGSIPSGARFSRSDASGIRTATAADSRGPWSGGWRQNAMVRRQRANVIYLTEKGLTRLASLTGETDLVTGKPAFKGAFEPDVSDYIARLLAIYDDTSLPSESRNNAYDLANALDAASRHPGAEGVILVDSGSGVPIAEIRTSRYHERTHEGIAAESGIPVRMVYQVVRHPLWSRITAALQSRDYTADNPMSEAALHIEETLTRLGSDDFASLGLSQEEADTLHASLLRTGEREGGEGWAERIHAGSSSDARRKANAARQAVVGSQAGTGAQEQSSPEQSSEGGRARSLRRRDENNPAGDSGDEGQRNVPGGVRTARAAESEFASGMTSRVLSLAVALRKAGLLSSPKTHLRNILSNTAFAGLEEAARLPASIADILLSLHTGERTVSGPDIRAMAGAGYTSATKGVREALAVMRGQSVPGESIVYANQPPSGIPAIDRASEFIYRLLEAQDRVAYSYAYQRTLTEHMKLNAARQSPWSPQAIQLQAEADALFATFRNKTWLTEQYREVHKSASESGKAGLDFFFPFVVTPTNLIARVFEYTTGTVGAPLRLAKDVMEGAQMTPEMQRAFARTFGRGTIGLGLITLGAWLASKGRLTSARPDSPDHDERGALNALEATGRQPGSLYAGGLWHEVQGIPPLGTLLVLGATLYEQGVQERRAGESALPEMAGSVGHLITDLPVLRGMHDIRGSLSNPSSLGRQAGSMAGSFVPALSADIAASQDRTARQRAAPMDYVAARIPWERQQLPARVDAFGQPVPERATLWNPFNSTRERTDDLSQEVLRTGARLEKVGAAKGGKPNVFAPEAPVRQPDTPQQAAQRQIAAGTLARLVARELIQDTAYRRLPVAQRKALLERVVTGVQRRMARPTPETIRALLEALKSTP